MNQVATEARPAAYEELAAMVADLEDQRDAARAERDLARTALKRAQAERQKAIDAQNQALTDAHLTRREVDRVRALFYDTFKPGDYCRHVDQPQLAGEVICVTQKLVRVHHQPSGVEHYLPLAQCRPMNLAEFLDYQSQPGPNDPSPEEIQRLAEQIRRERIVPEVEEEPEPLDEFDDFDDDEYSQ